MHLSYNPSIYPSIHPSIMSAIIAPPLTLQFSLSNDPRTDWYKDVCRASSTLLSHLDEPGGLFMVGNDDTWNTHPGNLTNAADVLANGNAIRVYRSYRHKHQYSSFTLPYIRSKNDKSQ